MENSHFKDKVVVITGASRGIGRELAFRLAAHGAKLSLAARNAGGLEAVRAECEQRGVQAIAVPTDVAEQAHCESLMQKTVEAFGGIDVLVNNAGISMWAMFEDVTDLSIFESPLRGWGPVRVPVPAQSGERCGLAASVPGRDMAIRHRDIRARK